MKLIPIIFLATALYGAEPYHQLLDNNVREIEIVKVYDGDTCTVHILMGKLGGQKVWMRDVRLRLKGVNCYELNAKEVKDRELAIVERAVLTRLLLQTGIITARLYHQTYDRFEADIYTRTGWVNETMRAQPQNK